MGDVKSFYSEPRSLEQLIQKLATDSKNVNFPALDHRKLIGVSVSEVFSCLENAKISSHPEPDEFENIAVELKHFHAGRELVVCIAVSPTNNQINILHAEG